MSPTDTKPLLLDHVDMRMVSVETDTEPLPDRHSIVSLIRTTLVSGTESIERVGMK